MILIAFICTSSDILSRLFKSTVQINRLETHQSVSGEQNKSKTTPTPPVSTSAGTETRKGFELNPAIVTKLQRESTKLEPREAMQQLKRRKMRHYSAEQEAAM